MKEQIATNGSSAQSTSALNQIISDKEFVIAGLMQQWLATGDFIEIENMLTAEQTLHTTQKLIGLKLLTQDYTAANSLINQLPNTQETYKRIQSINVDRLTTNEYSLPENDEEFLQSVALQKLPETAMAQSVLTLVKGESFAIVPPELPANTYSQEGAIVEEMSAGMVIAPNPARDLIRVDFSTSLEPAQRQLFIFNTQGVKIYEASIREGENSTIIKLDDFAPGLYYLNASDKEGNSEIQKFMIQR